MLYFKMEEVLWHNKEKLSVPSFKEVDKKWNVESAHGKYSLRKGLRL
jgi:hypothetical protein